MRSRKLAKVKFLALTVSLALMIALGCGNGDGKKKNTPPVADAGADQVIECAAPDTPVVLDGSGSSDSDGSISQYSWTQTGGDNVILTGSDTVSPSFTVDFLGIVTFELTVTDNGGATGTDTVEITINGVNECSEGTDNCNENATCIDTACSFRCNCYPGWEGNGVTCTRPNIGSVLIYHDGGDTVADEAVAAFGLTVIYTTDGTSFNSAFDAGGFELIIWDSPSVGLPSGAETRLATWVDANERLIFSWWDLDSSASMQSLLGVTVVSYSTWREVYPNVSAPVTFFGGVPVPLAGSDQATDNGDELTLTGNGFIAARLDSAVGPITGAIAVTNWNNVIVNGFLPWDCMTTDNDADGTPDMQEVYQNQIAYLASIKTNFVAIYAGDSDAAFRGDVRAKIEGTRLFSAVDLYDITITTPTLIELQSYDAVLFYSSVGWDGVAVGDVLADYMDTGGGVVLSTFAYNDDGLGVAGRIESDGYLAFTRAGQDSGTPLTLVADLPDHQILTNVSSFDGGTNSFHETFALTAGATLVAHWDNGYPLVATNEAAAGRIVGLNFFPPSSDVRGDFWDASTDGDWLMANALNWASGGEWPTVLFSEEFESGVLPAGWDNVNNGGDCVWWFDDPYPRGNLTGGSGGFAIADSDACGMGTTMDTELITPSMDLSSLTSKTLEFDYDFNWWTGGADEICDVDVNVDGGGWINVWQRSGDDYPGPAHEVVDITALAAGHSDVVVRFHYYNADWEYWWEVDNVIVIGGPVVILNP